MIERKSRILFVCVIALFFNELYAQNGVDSSGGNASGSGGTTSFSVGQVVYGAESGTSGSLLQGEQQAYEINITASVMLEGTYNTGTNLMRSNLNMTLDHPNFIPLVQPFNNSGWIYSYSGTEAVVAMPSAVVDWVLVELRQAPDAASAIPSTALSRRAVFLKSDGTLMELDGTAKIHFNNVVLTGSNKLFIVVRHRNHLAVMSSAGASPNISNGIYTYDFTASLAQAYGGAGGFKALGTKFGMVSGDIDLDGNIFVSDYNQWAVGFGNTGGYYRTDLDMDGNVFVSDYNEWAVNFGSGISTNLKSASTSPKYVSGVPE